MDVEVSRSEVGGRTRAPPSKSYTHRAVLAAGFSAGTTLDSPLLSADTRATIRAIEAFGADVSEREPNPAATDDEQVSLHVDGFDGIPAVPGDVIDCANSGTTMRLVTASAALADGLTVLTGDSSLRSRPQGPLLEAIRDLNGRAESTRRNGQAPLVVGGPIGGGETAIRGDVSSQFVTALLMAGAATEEGIRIELTTELKSAPYVEITRELLAAFGVDTERDSDGFVVSGGQRYAADRYAVPGDFSSMSYLLAAGAIAGVQPVVVEGAHPSAQGDSAIVDVLDRMGASIDWDRSAGEITVEESALTGIEVSVADTPDLLPTIAALGAVADGETRITECEHVRYKETDRVSAMARELEQLGARVSEERDRLTVHGGESRLKGASVESHCDHRLAMALAVAGLAAEGTTRIRDAEHVDVSFPGFFEALSELGARVRTPE